MKVLPGLANVRSRIAFGRCTSVVHPGFVAPDVAVLDRTWPRYSICEPSPAAPDSHRRMCQCGHNAIAQSGDLELLCHRSSETLGESGYARESSPKRYSITMAEFLQFGHYAVCHTWDTWNDGVKTVTDGLRMDSHFA